MLYFLKEENFFITNNENCSLFPIEWLFVDSELGVAAIIDTFTDRLDSSVAVGVTE